METKEEDYVVDLFITCSHDYVMYITNKGRVYWLKAYKIPVAGRHAKGKPIVNLLESLMEGEKVVNTIPVKLFTDDSYLVCATKNGTVKKTRLSAYSHIRQSGIIAIKLDEGDEVMDTVLTDGTKEIILATSKGLAARFLETDVRPTGRATYGVRGIRLQKDDHLVSMSVVEPKDQLLTVCENGYGKRSPVEDYRKIRRGGKGVITIKTGERNGDVVCAMKVEEDDELIVTSVNGMVIRMPVSGISVLSRATMGVRLMKLKEDDKVSAVTRLVGKAEEERAMEAGRSLTTCPTPNGDIVDENGDDKEGEEPEGEAEDDEGAEEDKEK
jgi:DNA gyrase subunit A